MEKTLPSFIEQSVDSVQPEQLVPSTQPVQHAQSVQSSEPNWSMNSDRSMQFAQSEKVQPFVPSKLSAQSHHVERMKSTLTFWCYRGLASLIDNTTVGALQMLIFVIGMSGTLLLMQWPLLNMLPLKPVAFYMLLVLLGISQVVAVIYHSLQEHSRYQSTLGQRQFGFLVESKDSHRLTLQAAIFRNIWRLIVSPVAALVLFYSVNSALPTWFPTVFSTSSPMLVIFEVLFVLSMFDALVSKVQTGVPTDWATTTVPILTGNENELIIHTERGPVKTRAYFGNCRGDAVVAIGGCGAGFNSPAQGLYHRIGQILKKDDVTTLWLRVRRPAELEDAIYDVRAAVNYLTANGFSRIVLIGHSFGGAAVVCASAFEPKVSGLILVASQNACTELVSSLAPRPVLIIHGKNDRVIPPRFAQDVFNRVNSKKEICYFAGGHGLHLASEAVFNCVHDWLGEHFAK